MAAPTWQELLQWIKPEPTPPDESELAANISPAEYTIYSEKLNNICVEGREIFVRNGATYMLRSGDNIVGVYTRHGDMVCAYCGTYLHAVTAQLPVKFTLARWKDNPSVGIQEGDCFLANDAIYGGIHNPDIIAFMPVFYKGELVAWVAAAVHAAETGGCDPGGMCTGAKARCDEGMKIPPMKIGTNYQLHEDFLEMVGSMCYRSSWSTIIDIRARFTACDRMLRRITEVLDDKGRDFFVGLLRKMLMTAQEGARDRIKSWNDGIYRAVVFHDMLGRMGPRLIRVVLSMRKDGDRLIMDFTGTSPENNGAYHTFPHGAVAHSALFIYGYAFCDLPVSAGIFDPIDYIFPEGTVVNPAQNAATSASPVFCSTIMSLTPMVLSKAMFGSPSRTLVAAPPGLTGHSPNISGINQWGKGIAQPIARAINEAGQGARSDKDGIDTWGFAWCSVSRAEDVEDTESETPVLQLFHKHWKDSCGFGKFRGGATHHQTIVVYHVPYCAITPISSGSTKLPVGQGLFGGYPGTTTNIVRISDTNILDMMEKGDKTLPADYEELITAKAIKGNYEFLPSLVPTFMASKGDIYSWGGLGGCGYGDVLERDPDLVMKDLRDQIISEWTVKNIYQVVYDAETLEVDYDMTRTLRQEARQKRLHEGINFEDFENKWLKRRPPEEALEFYGSWPDANKVRQIVRF